MGGRTEERRKQTARKNSALYPGCHMIFRVKRLPLNSAGLESQKTEYLFYAVDGFSSELYAMIGTDESMNSAIRFLDQLHEECAYKIEMLTSDIHNFQDIHFQYYELIRICKKQGIQLVSNSAQPESEQNLVEYVEKQILDQWAQNKELQSATARDRAFARYLNYFNWVQPHAILNQQTPGERLVNYFYPGTAKN